MSGSAAWRGPGSGKSMADTSSFKNGDSFVNSIIGEGTALRGDFELNGLLRIDGVFSGSVKTMGKVLVGKNGTAECDVAAGTVVIGGRVRGNIVALEKVTLLSTGELIGSIKTPRLIIEEGVIFEGTCEIIDDKEKLERLKGELFQKNKPTGNPEGVGTAERSTNSNAFSEEPGDQGPKKSVDSVHRETRSSEKVRPVT
jgi:cytoskeletal protein CcmA (bactofilin family)